MAANISGIVINEILADPTGSVDNFDTDRDGSTSSTDEFIELYNTSSTYSVDISGWTLRDRSGTTFTFPSNTVVAPDGKVTVVTQYDAPVPPGFYHFDRSSEVWDDGGDIVALSNGSREISIGYRQISAGYNGTNGDDDFGDGVAGQSLQRTPKGSNNIISNTPTPECFLTGTRILTETGYKAVEELQIGDKVQTAEGDLADVKWIGYQTIEPGNVKNPLRGYPVLIKAGALGDNLPCRDLYISPDHALLIDGLLINAGALVNDISIVKTNPSEAFIYHSIELEHHALLVAEGTHAESYMPHHEERHNYDNGAEYEQLYPHGSNLMLWPMDYPRISSKGKVPGFVSRKLMQIAERLFGEVALIA